MRRSAPGPSPQDRYDCMMKLQRAGVPAGVCQNAEDRSTAIRSCAT